MIKCYTSSQNWSSSQDAIFKSTKVLEFLFTRTIWHSHIKHIYFKAVTTHFLYKLNSIPNCTRLLCPSCLSNNISNTLWNSTYCYFSFSLLISFPLFPPTLSFFIPFSPFLSLARSPSLLGFYCSVWFRCCLCCFLAAQVPRSTSSLPVQEACPSKPRHFLSNHTYLETRLWTCQRRLAENSTC